MLLRQPFAKRPGGTAVLTLLMLMPLLLIVAFAIDLNYIWRADAELQDAADAAALAGTSQLLVGGQVVAPNGVSPLQLTIMRQAAGANATRTAQSYAHLHRAGDVALVVNTSDVEFGYIADPTAKDGTPQGQFQTSSAQFPNSVRVTVRRDDTVSTGPLSLFFGGIFGTPTSSRHATAVATLRGQNLTGFTGAGSKLLPLAIDQATYNWLRGTGPAPLGGIAQDLFTVTAPLVSGVTPPVNVLKFADGVPEGTVTPALTNPGNFGTVALTNSRVATVAPFQNWLLNGPSSVDLASFGPQGLQATATTPQTMYGGPGLTGSVSLNLALLSAIGESRVLLLYNSVSGSSPNLTYNVIGFVGATVVSVDLLSIPAVITVQLNPTVDPTATPSPSGASGSANLVYTGVSLSR